MRFVEGQAACGPKLPIPPASPTGPPFDPEARLLNAAFPDSTTKYLTSWGTVIPGPQAPGAPHYAAAPKGADPFGKDAVVHPQVGLLLGPRDPGQALADTTTTFPLAPYSEVAPGNGVQEMTREDIELLEKQVISPTRRTTINASETRLSGSAAASLNPAGPAAASAAAYRTTTPTGLIATVETGVYTKLLLGQIMPPGATTPERQVAFLSLLPELQAAFQTSDLMLVVANAELLGEFVDGQGVVTPDGTPKFCNVLNIDEWKFTAGVGANPGYGDY
jgi:hypothetical protein